MTARLARGARLAAGGRRRRAASHPGFAAVAEQIAIRERVPLPRARAILAARTRHASAAARRRNPRLNRVR